MGYLAIIFALLFITGSAFAISGALEVWGTVALAEPLRLEWVPGEYADGVGWEGTHAPTNDEVTTSIVVVEDGEATLSWYIGFLSEGEITLTAYVENTGNIDAEITGFDVFSDVISLPGIIVSYDDTGFLNAILDPGDRAYIAITVEWDGEWPADTLNPAASPFDDGYYYIGHFIVEIIYEAS